jgi:NodT family efflux transporter outer membrane factor (OMF) lipoprotein
LFVASAFAAKAPVPKPQVDVPASFRNQDSAASTERSQEWWKTFGDPLLDQLMDRAAAANLDIRKAAARLTEAEAMRNGSRSALLPSLDSDTTATRLRGGFNQGVVRVPRAPGAPPSGAFVSPFETSVLSSGFNMRWELDVFGGLRKTLNASKADVKAADEYVRDVRVLVRAEVARNYVELRGTEEQMAIVRANVVAEKDLLDLIRSRAEAGLASELDVERQVTQLSAVNAVLPDLDAQRLHAIHRISVLLGEEPSALLAELQAPAHALTVPAVPLAVPGEVLKRRPDVRRAEAQITAAYARAGAARSDLYPKFVITGLSGRQSTDVSGLTLGAGNFFSVGPGITLPIFNAGRIRSKIAVQDAQLTEAVRSYEQDVLAALEETENAFVSRDRAEQRRRFLEVGVTAAKRSIEMAEDLYLHGLSDFLTVLDAQRQKFQVERELSSSNTAVLRNTIALYKALGE